MTTYSAAYEPVSEEFWAALRDSTSNLDKRARLPEVGYQTYRCWSPGGGGYGPGGFWLQCDYDAGPEKLGMAKNLEANGYWEHLETFEIQPVAGACMAFVEVMRRKRTGNAEYLETQVWRYHRDDGAVLADLRRRLADAEYALETSQSYARNSAEVVDWYWTKWHGLDDAPEVDDL